MTKKIEKNISEKVPRKFNIGDKVYAKNFYGDKWLAAEVIKVSGPLSYQVKSEGVILRRHVDHIRKRYPMETTTQDDWDMPDGLSSQVEITAREIPLEPPTTPPSIPPPLPLVHSSPERRYSRRIRTPIDLFSPSQYS